MLFAPTRFASRRDTIAFVVCIVLAVGARFAPENIQRGVASVVRSTVLAPFLAIHSQTVSLQAALERAEQVSLQRDSLAAEALELVQLREENRRLREQLGLRARLQWRGVPAEVLYQDDLSGPLLSVSAGSDQGVKQGDPVIVPLPEGHGAEIQTQGPPGLLGVVKSTEADKSFVTPWTDLDFGAGAMTADGKVLGIVGSRGSDGPSWNMMELRGVPFLEVVAVGTEVVTSGMGLLVGGVYPPGLLLGVVEGEEEGEVREGWSRTYILRPAVQPMAVSHVIILTRPGEDVTGASGVDPT